MDFAKEEGPVSLTFSLKGRLDATSAPELDAKLTAVGAQEKRSIVLDFAGCDYISSAGLRALLAEAKRSKAAMRKFILCGLSPQVAEVIRISGFDRIFTIAPNKADAQRLL